MAEAAACYSGVCTPTSAADLVFDTRENSLRGPLVDSTVCSPAMRHFSPHFRAVTT